MATTAIPAGFQAIPPGFEAIEEPKTPRVPGGFQAIPEGFSAIDGHTQAPASRIQVPGPQIQAEEIPAKSPPIISTTRIPASQVMPPEDDRSDTRRFLETPILSPEGLKKDLRFLVGPFALHKGIIQSAAQMTSPESAAIIAGTGGLGMAASATTATLAQSARVAQAGLSAYFATQAGRSFLQKSPELARRWKAGDWQGALEVGGEQLMDAAVAAGATLHAAGSAKGAVDIAKARIGLQSQLDSSLTPEPAPVPKGLISPPEPEPPVAAEPAGPMPVVQPPPGFTPVEEPAGITPGTAHETPVGKFTVTGNENGIVTFDQVMPDGSSLKDLKATEAKFQAMAQPPAYQPTVASAQVQTPQPESHSNVPAIPDINYRRITWRGGPGNYWVLPDSADKQESGPYPSAEAAARALQDEQKGLRAGAVVDMQPSRSELPAAPENNVVPINRVPAGFEPVEEPPTPEEIGQKLIGGVRQQAMESAGRGIEQPQPPAELPEIKPAEVIPFPGRAAPVDHGPGWVGNIPTSEIRVDAPRFQFKANVGQGGAGEEFRDVQKWDPEKAGVIAVWKDPADGKTYVVNGHHRVEMAQRLGAPEMTVRYLDAANAQEAFTKGALINIAEGRGESTDAAKVFRSTGMSVEDLKKEGISLKGKIASEGLALSNLSNGIFQDVIDGTLPAARGAVIGAGVPNHADQQALYDLIKARERSGKRMTNDQIEELIRLNNRTSTVTEQSEQGGLFGEEEMTRSLLPEKAEISDYVRKQLSTEKKLFGVVSTQAAAERLGEQGNVIKAGENAQVAERANQGIAVYDKLSQSAGNIDRILDSAAKELADGKPAAEVKQRAYREIRDEVTGQVDKLAGVSPGSASGVEGLGAEGTREAGGGEHPGALAARKVGTSGAPWMPEEAGLFSGDEEEASRKADQSGKDKLLGDQLTAQIKSGMAAKPTKLKPAEQRDMFEEEGPEQESLFAKRPVSPDQMDLFGERATTADDLKLPARRETTFSVDPRKIPSLPNAARPTNDPPTREDVKKFWGAVESKPGNLGGRPALFVNNVGMEVILRRMGQAGSGQDSGYVYGLTLAPSEWHRVLEEAEAASGDPRDSGFDDALIGVGADIAEMMGKQVDLQKAAEPVTETDKTHEMRRSGLPTGSPVAPPITLPKNQEPASSREQPLIVLQVGRGMKAMDIKRVAEEEYDHASQLALPKGLRGLPTEIVETPAGQKAAEALTRDGYPELKPASSFYAHNRALIAAEIGARLMRPGRYTELNLTAQEARDLAEQYIEGLKRKNGASAGSIVEQTYAAIAQNQAALAPRFGGVESQHPQAPARSQEGEARAGPSAGQAVSGNEGILASRKPADAEPTDPERGSLSLGITKPATPTKADLTALDNAAVKNAVQAVRASDSDKDFGGKLRTMVTGARDTIIAETNQLRNRIQRIIPDHVDQEALTLYRDFKSRPNELREALAGTGPVYADVKPEDLPDAVDRVRHLQEAIDRALDPTPGLLKADAELTKYFTRTLFQGRQLGFLNSSISNEDYITHLLQPKSDQEKDPSLIQKAMGRGRIGPKNFSHAKERFYPTVLHAVAAGINPRTLNAVDALTVYGERFGKTASYRIFVNEMKDAALAKWGTYSDQKNGHIPADWVELYPESRLFRNEVAFNDSEGAARMAHQMLFVPRPVADAMRPVFDPNWMSRVPFFMSTRTYQGYLKTVELGMSFFHMKALNVTGLSNMGLTGLTEAYMSDMQSPEFERTEQGFIRAGGTTPILGRTIEAYKALQPSSLPTVADKIRGLPVLKQADAVAAAVTRLTFDIVQRKLKVVDFSIKDGAWLAKHPGASAEEHFEAQRSIAKEINAAYGGLQWENMGVHRISLELSRALLLAPDWTFSNVVNVKYALEGKRTPSGHGPDEQASPEWTAGGNAARLFWIKSAILGLGLTYGMSMLLSRRTPKDPTQVLLGKNAKGQDIYQNMFFVGAPGDLVTLIHNTQKFGAVVGTARTIANKFGPIARTSVHLITNEDERRRPIVKPGTPPGQATLQGIEEVGRELAPAPFSISTIGKMLLDKKQHYTAAEYAATAINGRQPLPLPKPVKHR